MTKEGIVTRIDGDTAVVLVKTMNACDVCRAECGGHCDKARLEKVCAKNDIGASVGNRVMLYSDTKSVMLFSQTGTNSVVVGNAHMRLHFLGRAMESAPFRMLVNLLLYPL